MKKQRFATTLSVLCEPDDRDAVMDVIYRETTTLGIRMKVMAKDELERTVAGVRVGGEEIRVKIGLRAGEVITVSPEYEDAVRTAKATGMPLREVYRAAIAEFEKSYARSDR